MNKLLLSGLSLLFVTALHAQAGDATDPNATPIGPRPTEPIPPSATLALGTDATQSAAVVLSNQPKYFGAVILSLSPNVRKFDCCLPMILADYAVLGVGFGVNHLLSFPLPKSADGDTTGADLVIYGQSLVLTPDMQLAVSKVESMPASN